MELYHTQSIGGQGAAVLLDCWRNTLDHSYHSYQFVVEGVLIVDDDGDKIPTRSRLKQQKKGETKNKQK